MKVFLQSKPGVSINLSDFKGAGGEGAVYIHQGKAFKIYGDADGNGNFAINPSKMMNPAKIRELSVLSDRRIVKPEEIVVNAQGTPIGYVMNFVDNVDPIVFYFSAKTQARLGVTTADRMQVTSAMTSMMAHCHAHSILLVDPNENNWLIGKDKTSVWAIDVDGYQTPTFPAKAILPDIRDALKPGFDESTDWYSLAYVLCRYWFSIGAYDCTFDKGGAHESRDPLFLRTKFHSIFDPKCSHRPLGIDESTVPPDVLNWFKATFQQGMRVPFKQGNVITLDPTLIRKMSMQITVVSNVFKVALKKTFTHDIIGINDFGVSIQDGKGWNVTVNNNVFRVYINNASKIIVENDRGVVTETIYYANNIRMQGNHVYFSTPGQVSRLSISPMPNGKALCSSVLLARTTTYSTQLFEGVVLQDMLGTYVANILTPNSSPQVSLPELRGHLVIDAKVDGTVLMVLASKAGKTFKYTFRFNSEFTKYTYMLEETKDTEVNFVALSTGVCLSLDSDGNVKIFYSDNSRPDVKVVHDDALQGVQLCRIDSKAMFYRGKELYTLSMG